MWYFEILQEKMLLVWSFPKRWGGGDKWRPCPLIIYCGVLGGSHSWEKENIDHWVLRILTCPLVLSSSTVRSHDEVCGTTCQASHMGVLFFWSVAAGYVQVNSRPAIPLRSGLELQLTFDFVLNWIITYYPVYLLAFVSWVWKTTDGGSKPIRVTWERPGEWSVCLGQHQHFSQSDFLLAFSFQ